MANKISIQNMVFCTEMAKTNCENAVSAIKIVKEEGELTKSEINNITNCEIYLHQAIGLINLAKNYLKDNN